MNALFVLADGQQTTFYLFSMAEGTKRLFRIRPERLINNQQVLAQYQQQEVSNFAEWVGAAFGLSKVRYVVLEKKALVDYLFRDREKIAVSNPSDFTYYGTEEKQFKKGKQSLGREDFEKFITYQADSDDKVFDRQEHVLRLIKQEVIDKGNAMTIPSRFNEFKQIVATNLKVTDTVKFGIAYQNAKAGKIQRVNYES